MFNVLWANFYFGKLCQSLERLQYVANLAKKNYGRPANCGMFAATQILLQKDKGKADLSFFYFFSDKKNQKFSSYKTEFNFEIPPFLWILWELNLVSAVCWKNTEILIRWQVFQKNNYISRFWGKFGETRVDRDIKSFEVIKSHGW